MNLENVSRDDRILIGVGVLLIIDLLFLPWLTFSYGPLSASSSATGSPDAWLGVLAMLATLALVADLAIERFSPQTTLPALNGSRTHTRFVEACVAAVFVVLKFIFHVDFSGSLSFGFGFYLAVILTAALVYFALQARNAGIGVAGSV